MVKSLLDYCNRRIYLCLAYSKIPLMFVVIDINEINDIKLKMSSDLMIECQSKYNANKHLLTCFSVYEIKYTRFDILVHATKNNMPIKYHCLIFDYV